MQVPADFTFSIQASPTKTVNFFLRETGRSTADLFHGSRKIGTFWQLPDGTWKVKFGAPGGIWTGSGSIHDLLEAVGRFVHFKGERQKHPSNLDSARLAKDVFFQWQYRSMDRDLTIEQASRDHRRLLERLDREIEKVAPLFNRVI